MPVKQSQLTARVYSITNKQGFSLVEIVLVSALFVLLASALIGNLVYGQESTMLAGNRSRAVFLAEEGLEATRNIRDDDFANLVDGTYGLYNVGGEWSLVGSFDINDIYTRQVIVSSIDANTKQITSQIDWQQTPQRTGTIALTSYLTNWSAIVIPGIGDWTNPAEDGFIDLGDNNNGYRIQTQGNYAYIIRTGGTPEFAIIDISDSASPSVTGSLNLLGSPRNIAVSGNYAYIASRRNGEELQVIDISNPASPSQVGSYDASGNDDGYAVAVVGTTVYLGRTNGTEFFIIDVSTPASPSLIGSLNLSGTIRDIAVVGDYAYLATYGTELQVIDISTPASPSLIGSLDLSGGSDAYAIVAFSNTVVLGRSSGDVHIIDVSTPASPSELGSYDALNDVHDLSLGNSNDYVFIASDENSMEFQVIDISTPASPSLVGFLDLSADLNGIAYNSGLDIAVAASDNNSTELTIIIPQ